MMAVCCYFYMDCCHHIIYTAQTWMNRVIDKIFQFIYQQNVIELKMMSHIRSEHNWNCQMAVILKINREKEKAIFHILWMCFFKVEIVFMCDMLYAVCASWCMTLIFPLFNSLMGNLLSFNFSFIPAIIFRREFS